MGLSVLSMERHCRGEEVVINSSQILKKNKPPNFTAPISVILVSRVTAVTF